MTLNKVQLARLDAWHNAIEVYWPALSAPIWLLQILDAILPTYCIFQQSIWLKGRLICYIPSLCQLNPFYDALLEYRTKMLLDSIS